MKWNNIRKVYQGFEFGACEGPVSNSTELAMTQIPRGSHRSALTGAWCTQWTPMPETGFVGRGVHGARQIANGRDKHALVASGLFPDATPFPAFIRAYCLTPGGGDKTAAWLAAVDHARDGGAVMNVLSLDRGYTNEPAVNLPAPMIDRGVRLVMDNKQHQHRTRVHAPGVLEIDGNFYTDATPVGLRELPAHAKNTSTKARRELSARYDQRGRVHVPPEWNNRHRTSTLPRPNYPRPVGSQPCGHGHENSGRESVMPKLANTNI